MPSPNLVNSGLINVSGLAQSTGLLTELHGAPERVQFIVEATGTVLSCDATLSQTHAFDSMPTLFPVEDGSAITDHIIQNPLQLSITGVVSDTPLRSSDTALAQVFGNAASGLLPPLGVTTASLAYALYTDSKGAIKPSQNAYETLLKLRLGDPTASPPVPPQPFVILTKYARYEGMVITSLTFPVDASTDGLCVFTLTATRLLLVTPQLVKLALFDDQALAAGKADVGEQEPLDTSEAAGHASENATQGHAVERKTAAALRELTKAG